MKLSPFACGLSREIEFVRNLIKEALRQLIQAIVGRKQLNVVANYLAGQSK